MAKKSPSNSAASAVKAMVNAARPLPNFPAHLRQRPAEKPFWEAIVKSRARDEWSENDLIVAAQLARTQYEIEATADLLESEGAVIVNFRGTQIMNPRQSVMEQLARRQLALMRSLRMSGASTGVDKRDLDKARKVERSSRAAREELEEDDLLA